MFAESMKTFISRMRRTSEHSGGQSRRHNARLKGIDDNGPVGTTDPLSS